MTKRTHEDVNYPEMAFFMNESKSDVVFVVDGQRLPAIKQLLIVKSRVFEAMFSGNFYETNVKEIPIGDTTFDAFHSLLWFIYSDQLILKDDNDLKYAFDVYHLSDRYEVLRLGQRVGKHLVSKINLKDLVSISKVIFTLNVEKLMSKVMAFIESNAKEWIEWNTEKIKEINESTNDRLLDVLISGGFEYNYSFKEVVFEDRTVFIKKDILLKNGIKDWYESLFISNTTFDAFKTFVGFLYFEKLILKDSEDFQLIRNVCEIFNSRFKSQSFFVCVQKYLKNRITVENLESISGIAFGFKIEGLMKRVNEFIKENFYEIFAKSNEELCKIDDSTHNSLLLIIIEKHRKCLQKDI